ncbi:hypothetical protein B0A55_13684, partial [Friedmanniomyces simplex]
LIPLNPKDLYTIQAAFDYFIVTTTIHQSLETTTFYPSAPMNYHDLTGLPPGAAYQAMPICVAEDCGIITPSRFHPQLVLPTQVRALDPAWRTCGLAWQGLWDPPVALQSAGVVDPVTTPAGVQEGTATVSASAASGATAEVPLPTSGASSSARVLTEPGPAVSSGASLPAPDPVGATLPPSLSASAMDPVEATSQALSLGFGELPGSSTTTSSQLPGTIVPPLSTAAPSDLGSTLSTYASSSESNVNTPTGQPSPTNAYEVLSQAQQSAASSAASPAVPGTSADAASSPSTVPAIVSDDPGSIETLLSSVAPATSTDDPAMTTPGDQTMSLSASAQPQESDPTPSSSPQSFKFARHFRFGDVLQQAEPSRFRSSKFKIQKQGHHEESHIKNFSTYSGPDLMTHK